MGQKTALYEMHKKYGGKVVDYAGWELSVEFEGLVPEHLAVRNGVGMFDVSHMGEIEVTGKDAAKFVQYLNTNDLSGLVDKQIAYGFMCNENGGIVEDLLTYKFNSERYLLVVNASNIAKDVEWVNKQAKDFDVTVKDLSPEIAEVAIQGPLAQKVLQKVVDINLDDVKFFFLEENVDVAGAKCLISRTGYTGEDGFEVYFANEDAEKVWEALMEAGKEEEIKPVGLGCRDTLRFEVNLPLYGNELGEDITPLEAGYGFFVKLNVEDDFIGKAALVKQKEEGLKRKVVGFELVGKGIPRHGYDVAVGGEIVGFVTTGYRAPSIGKSIGMAMVPVEHSALDTEIDIMVRNKPVKAKVTSRKFLEKHTKTK